MRYLRTVSDIALARSLAVTREPIPASAHRELSVALVQSQGYVYRSGALLVAKVSGQQGFTCPVVPHIKALRYKYPIHQNQVGAGLAGAAKRGSAALAAPQSGAAGPARSLVMTKKMVPTWCCC
jgi:hypothetical protein